MQRFIFLSLLMLIAPTLVVVAQDASSQNQSLYIEPLTLTFAESGLVFLAFVGLILLVLLVGFLVSRLSNHRQLTSAVIGFTSIGAMIGLITGMSKTPIASTAVTAVLGLVTAIVAYLFASEKVNEKAQYIVGNMLTGFGILLIMGLFLGATLRGGVVLPGGATASLNIESTHDEKYEIAVSTDRPVSSLKVFEVINESTPLLDIQSESGSVSASKMTWFADDQVKISWPGDPDEQSVIGCTGRISIWWRDLSSVKESRESLPNLQLLSSENFEFTIDAKNQCSALIPPLGN